MTAFHQPRTEPQPGYIDARADLRWPPVITHAFKVEPDTHYVDITPDMRGFLAMTASPSSDTDRSE